jgi:hypothetical protein
MLELLFKNYYQRNYNFMSLIFLIISIIALTFLLSHPLKVQLLIKRRKLCHQVLSQQVITN